MEFVKVFEEDMIYHYKRHYLDVRTIYEKIITYNKEEEISVN